MRKAEVLHVRLPAETRAIVKAVADAQGKNESEFVRGILTDYLVNRLSESRPPADQSGVPITASTTASALQLTLRTWSASGRRHSAHTTSAGRPRSKWGPSMTGRPRLPRSDECETCHWYHCGVCCRRLDALPFEERQKIAAHRLEHQRLDRRRETWIRYSKGNRRQRASSTTSAAPDPQPAAAASSTGSRRAA